MENTYFWVKSLHIIAVISWMAGILYLPRIFVYHAQAEAGGEADKTFQVMERKLLRIIMNPSMILTYVFGLWLADILHAWADPWFHVKAALVLFMTVLHMMCARWRKDFEKGSNTKSHVYFRIMNEVGTFLMIGIVVLVVLKPSF